MGLAGSDQILVPEKFLENLRKLNEPDAENGDGDSDATTPD